MNAEERQPLLADDTLGDHARQQYHGIVVPVSYNNTFRTQVKRFLLSKYGHYAVLFLVSLDVGCIFADFLISLFICDHTCAKGEPVSQKLLEAQDALGIASLVFSCLFMTELLASIWAFGLEYFKSKFHCFDATIIVAGFIIDVCLKGVLEEAGSIVVILRLWRVFKIVEEFSAGASDEMDTLAKLNEELERENSDLKRENSDLKRGLKTPIADEHAR